MKHIILATIVLASSVSAFALTPKGETVKKKAVETYVATKEYTIEQKNEFVAGLKSELNEVDKDIAVMKAKASAETKSQVEALEKKRAELNVKIDKLSSASKSAWTELRSGVQSAFKEMKTSFNKASDKFNEEN